MNSQLPSLGGPPTGQPTLKGEDPGNLQQEQKFSTCLTTIRNPPWARFLALPLFPSHWLPFGQQGQVSLLGRQDIDCTDSQSTLFFYQIYSPDPATSMGHSRSDLLSPVPSLWNTGPHSHGQSPWGEDRVCSG